MKMEHLQVTNLEHEEHNVVQEHGTDPECPSKKDREEFIAKTTK